MDTLLDSPYQNPSPPLNSASSSSNPNSPFQTQPPSHSDFDNFSPLSSEPTPDFSTPDPAFSLDNDPPQEAEEEKEFRENEPLDIFPRREILPYSVYRWSEPWDKKGGEFGSLEESHLADFGPRMSSSDFTQCPKNNIGLEFKPHMEDYLTNGIRMEQHDKPFASDFLSESNPSLVGAGLSNLGNTCFLNSILQCFIHTVPLLQGLLSYDHKGPCECDQEAFCAICALSELIELSLSSTGRVVSPWKLVNNLSYFSSVFQRFQQEDAHEFLQCFLDRLESRCLDAKRDNTVSLESCNFVKKVFGGRLLSKLKCCNCGYCSDTYEPSIDLSLEIEDAVTLSSALESFTKVEKIEDSEMKFTCEKCKEKVSVEKQLLLDQAPSVAAFHLKRFKNDGSFVEKIDKYVQFPLELDMLPYTGLTQSDAQLKYDLFAVVVHIGFSSTSGHYYCFIRSSPDTWYKFDDSKVVQVQEEFVLSQEAYILFYAKQGTQWFSSFIESHKHLLDPALLNTSPKSVLDSVDVCSSSRSMLNNYGCAVIDTSDVAEGAVTENLSGPQENEAEGGEAIDGFSKPAPVAIVACNSPDVPSYKDNPMISPSAVKETKSCEFGAGRKNANITPETPPRCSSPEIYKEDPPDNVYSIPRGHLKMMDQASCKRQLNNDLEDMERKQACRLIKKNIPGSRGQQLMSAMNGSRSESSINKKRSRMETFSSGGRNSIGAWSEGSLNKKRRRTETSPSGDDRNSSANRRSTFGPGARILAASSLR